MNMANCFLRLLSYNVVIVSVAMFALGIANITVTCSNSMSSCALQAGVYGSLMLFPQAATILLLAVGIWASLPCLLGGIGTVRSLNKPPAGRNWLWATNLASAFFFTPLLVIFSAFNATTAMAAINSVQSANLQVTSQMTVAFALPLTIAILAGLVHLHFLLILCAGCRMDEGPVQVVEVVKPAPAPQIQDPVLRSTAWHVSAPGARCNCQHYGQSPYGH